MTETIEYEQFDQAEQSNGAGSPEADLSRLSDIPMELSVEIGRAHITVGETLDLHPGSVVSLERQAGEPADLLVNGTPIARGEVIVVDEQYGLRITEILDGRQDADSADAQMQSAADAVATTESASAEDPDPVQG